MQNHHTRSISNYPIMIGIYNLTRIHPSYLERICFVEEGIRLKLYLNIEKARKIEVKYE